MRDRAQLEVESRRTRVFDEWRDLRGSLGSETSLRAGGPAWLVGIAGLAVGLELARLVLGRRRSEDRDRLSPQHGA